ncbi:MAG: ester cyclase [Hyphomicrobium sp.]|uniref:ester cyclase n=1 Tax=Hyphomicrobium sp. TaxID=82 RepID=UPI003D0C9370
MSTLEANKALARRFYEEFWCKGNAEAADALVAEDVIQPQLPPGWPIGREGFKQVVRLWRRGFPDMHEDIELLVAEGDWVIGRFRLTGTHRGPFYDLEPTGRRVDIHGIDALRIVDGRVVEWIYQEDTLGLFQQLGRMPGDVGGIAGTAAR